jgi:hypothetical protein
MEDVSQKVQQTSLFSLNQIVLSIGEKFNVFVFICVDNYLYSE